MLKNIRHFLSQLVSPRSVVSRGPKNGPPDGEAFMHHLNVMCLGEQGAADLEHRLTEYHREKDYADRVERMERVVELRRRERVAKAQFDSLR